MRESSAYRNHLRVAGIVLAAVFGFLIAVVILCATHPERGLSVVFHTVCHQQPHRCHMLDGVPLGVCIRCFWLYVGLFIGHARFAIFQHIPKWSMHFLVFTATAAALDWISGWWFEGGNPIGVRIVTSLSLGIAISHLTTPGVVSCFSTNSSVKLRPNINHEYK